MTGASMVQLDTWPLAAVLAALLGAALVIGIFGTALTRVAERLAWQTGLGQALFGAVFLGGATSLPGITTSVVAASQGHAKLAVSNAIGGIAAQTVFLAIADASYRRANLEHAAANVANLLQGALLVALLALPLLGMASASPAYLGVHPVSPLIFIGYVFGVRLIGSARTQPMWMPERTAETQPKEAEGKQQGAGRLIRSWLTFIALALVVALAGWLVAASGAEVARRTPLSESVVGAFLTAIVTSLPELVTSVVAVRRGALTLAVGDILGGNCFDVVFVAAADVAYREGSVYAAIGQQELFVMALTVLLTAILLLGLLRREKHGIANIGFESFLAIVLYLGGLALLALG